MHKDFKGNELSVGDLVGLPLPEGLQPVVISKLMDDEESRIEIHPYNKPEVEGFTIPSKNTFLIKKKEELANVNS